MAHFTLVSVPYSHETTPKTFVAILDGSQAQTIESFYDLIAQILNFPDYFGKNLDALDEMINDLGWIEQKTVVVVFRNYGDLLADENEEMKEMMLTVLETAAEEWKEFGDGDKKLKFVIEDTEAAAEDLDAIGVAYRFDK